jgi:hypothetical protein
MVEEFTEGQDTIEVSTTNIDNITTLEANWNNTLVIILVVSLFVVIILLFKRKGTKSK